MVWEARNPRDAATMATYAHIGNEERGGDPGPMVWEARNLGETATDRGHGRIPIERTYLRLAVFF